MRTVILHVGMHKTGTSSVQQSLEGFASPPIKYLDLSNANHTVPIRAAFSERIRPQALKLKSEEDVVALKRSTLERLDEQLAEQQFDKFIISGEGIVRLTPKALRTLKEFLLRHVDQIRVFAYMREPVGYSCSAFQQRVKGGGSASYELPRADYRSKFEKFMDVFGADNFSAKVFSSTTLLNGSVVADFCQTWGIPLDPAREVRTNESLSETAVKLVHLLNRSDIAPVGGHGVRRPRVQLMDWLNSTFPGKFILPPRFHGGAIDLEDLEWLRARCGIDFAATIGTGTLETWPEDEFKQYLDAIDPKVVSEYKELLARMGVQVAAGDDAAALLGKHFNFLAAAPAPKAGKRRPLFGKPAMGGASAR